MGRAVVYRWSLSLFIILIGVAFSPADLTVSASASGGGQQPLLSTASTRHRAPSPSSSFHENPLAKSIIKSLEKGAQATSQRLPSIISRSSPALQASRRSYPNTMDQSTPHLTYGVVVEQASAMSTALQIPKQFISKLKARNPPNAGYYYGLQPHKIFPYHSSKEDETKKELAMATTLTETLEEMRNMRKELQTLRREMYEMRKKITGEQDLEFEGMEEEEADPEVTRLAKLKRERKYNKIGNQIEDWARKLLFEEPREGNGWTEIACNKVVKGSYNPDGRTTCYLAWLKDSRGKHAFRDDEREYPCIKVFGTIDASLEDVCTYLSREEHMSEYNDIITDQRDLEVIAPHAKITRVTSPQVLFVKPREFVTFVHHKWLKDGTLVMVNQACDHKDAPAVTEEGKGKAPRAYALRGATYIYRDKEDPQKTRMAILAHASPGGDIPQWATKTAINAVTPLEPFKLFARINDAVQKAKPEIEKLRMQRIEDVSVPGRSNQPVGMAQIGFAAFWPKGGGIKPAELDNNNQTNMNMHPSPQSSSLSDGSTKDKVDASSGSEGD